MRCFIAADISEEVRLELGTVQTAIKQKLDCQGRDLKWVHPDLIHVTLKFLGDVPDNEAVAVCRAAETAAQRHTPFDLSIEGVGHFGGRCARTLWAGTGEGSEPLAALHRDLEQALDEIGWPPEPRRFSAHLTLCRVRNPGTGFDLARSYQPWEGHVFGDTRIDTVTVYHSQLTPAGPIYAAMGTYDLMG
jgi:2'-5' RNA ligase